MVTFAPTLAPHGWEFFSGRRRGAHRLKVILMYPIGGAVWVDMQGLLGHATFNTTQIY